VTSESNGILGRWLITPRISEYYRDKDGRERSSSEWSGKGAEKLGLTGSLTQKRC